MAAARDMNGDVPPLRRTLPTLPELSTEPDHRELAMAYATMAASFYQQWPALVHVLDTHGKKLDVLLSRQPADTMRAVRVLTVLVAILMVAVVVLLAAGQYHGSWR